MKKYLYIIPALAALAACSPAEYDLGAQDVQVGDLVEGIAFKVEPDATNPNIIHLTSLMPSNYSVAWEHPMGRSTSSSCDVSLPFSGDYEVTFGVDTRAGWVWGETYTFTVAENDFGMLSDAIWTNLAGGVDENGNGNPKTWVPLDKAYGSYQGSSPVGYMNPDDIMNDGTGITDITIGNWSMNWDPGFQSWLIPEDDPYMESSMILSLDATKGCVVEVNKNTSSGMTSKTGSFALNVSDTSRPTITFNNTDMLYAAWGEGVCSNYSKDIKILTCDEYVLQLATMRTNSEGSWWIVWNYVWEEVKNGNVVIPSDDPELLPTYSPELPSYDDLATELFTISGDEATYVASQTTLLLDEEKPYDLIWWNPATAAWEWIDGYGSTWAPEYSDEYFSLTLTQAGKAELETEAGGSVSTTFEIVGSTLVFADEITLLEAGSHKVSGTEFAVMKCSADDNEVALGIPVEYDADGVANKYLCARMTIKPVGGSTSGATELKVDNSKIAPYVEASKYFRFEFYNPWAGKDDSEWPVDVTKLKLKKNQTLTVKFSVSGIDWTGTPMAALCCNMDDFSWEPTCFTNFQGVTFNTAGENTLSLTNNTGSTYTFYGNGCLTVCIELDGYASSLDIDNAVVNVTSLTIE